MKEKWKRAVGVFVVLFCILLGCEKKENEAETLVLDDLNDSEDIQAEGAEAAPKEEESAFIKADGQIEQEVPEHFVVHICGAVNNPGVYTLDSGSRIYQVVEAAGGFCEDAREDYLNQADLIADGMKIYVPTVEETNETVWTDISESTGIVEGVKEADKSGDAAGESELININTAGEELLCTLPGVGSTKARSIIAYREKNGAYQKIEDIMNVEGIKEGLFQKIRNSITI